MHSHLDMHMTARKFHTYPVALLLMIGLYIVTGKLGLLLAVPPGYATVIWPPSGIALGMLLVHGRRLWPGILIGSFLLNCHIAGAYSPENGVESTKLLVAFIIAVGSTLQAVAGRVLIARFIGLPLRFDHIRQVVHLFLLAAPLACLIAATTGIATLYTADLLPPEKIVGNWLAWWVGDMFGIMVFLPLMLVAPGNPNRLKWQGMVISTLPTVAMLALLVPLGLSFYAWKITSESVYRQGKKEFAALAVESEKVLMHRLNSYETALLGGAGFLQGSMDVSRADWRKYVNTLRLEKNFPGMNGIGWIKPVTQAELPSYLKKVRNDEPGFIIHPEAPDAPLYVITYIEPESLNTQAVGLNIAFEQHRREAAEKARDTAEAAITRKITLVQDEEQTPGFLLLQPFYAEGMPTLTEQERRAAFRGWIYAPFIAKQFLSNLTQNQGYRFHLRIYDGDTETPEALIYSSGYSDAPAFTVRKTVETMQQHWLVIWESTLIYENDEASENPLLILMGGLLFTGLFGLLLLVLAVRRMETMEWMAGERRYVLPLLIFLIISAGTIALYSKLTELELRHINERIDDDARDTVAMLNSTIQSKLDSLSRMARRWEVAGGTPERLWRNDAQSYLKQLPGLKRLEVHADSGIRWAEPRAENPNVAGLDAAVSEHQVEILPQAMQRHVPVVSAPFRSKQGYMGFVGYEPLLVLGKSTGILAGVFSFEETFGSSISKDVTQNYAVTLWYKGQDYYDNHNPLEQVQTAAIERKLALNDGAWTLRLTPTQTLVSRQRTSLPLAILVGGLLIAGLSALSVRYILISRLKSQYLLESNLLNATILSSASYMVITTDENGTVMTFNRAAEKALGYQTKEVVGLETPALWHDAQEVIERAWELSAELGETIVPGFDVFVTKTRREEHESRDWTFIRKDGTRFIGNLTVTAMYRKDDTISGYLGIVEDVTERKRAEQALRTSEETFRLAMASAPIGQALVSPDGRWLKVNRALCDLLGFSEEELLANDFQSITHIEDLAADMELVEKILSGQIRNYQLEKRYYHKSGRTIWTLLSVSLVRYPGGMPNYFIAQIQDISERRAMERMKNEFISTVSHELRTPLTSIRGSLGLIIGAMADQLPEKIKSLIDVAYNNCERLILLINDILDMEKISSGEMRYKLENVAVAELTQQALMANEAYAHKYHTHIVVEPIDTHLRIKVDAARYIQVLTNLLSNAAKFSPEGEPVRVSVTATPDSVRIAVADAGAGIPLEFQSRIFGKFLQADSSSARSKGGTGLGLHIAKQMVEHMNGIIGFETEVGKGTTFWVEFAREDNA